MVTKLFWLKDLKKSQFVLNCMFIENRMINIKLYYFEAVPSQECVQIFSRIHKIFTAYNMNHK